MVERCEVKGYEIERKINLAEKAAVDRINLSHMLFKDSVILKSSLSFLVLKAGFSIRSAQGMSLLCFTSELAQDMPGLAILSHLS